EGALEERVGEGAAVLGVEGALAARRERVEGARDELLPDARLAVDEDGGLGGRRLVHKNDDAAHRCRARDEARQPLSGHRADLPGAEAIDLAGLLAVARRELGAETFYDLDATGELLAARAQLAEATCRVEEDGGRDRERLEDGQVRRVELAPERAVVDVEDAVRLTVEPERHAEDRAELHVADRGDAPRPLVGRRVRDELGLAREGHALHDRARELKIGTLHALAVEVARRGDLEARPRPRGVREREDEPPLGAHELDRAVEDPLDEALVVGILGHLRDDLAELPED